MRGRCGDSPFGIDGNVRCDKGPDIGIDRRQRERLRAGAWSCRGVTRDLGNALIAEEDAVGHDYTATRSAAIDPPPPITVEIRARTKP